MGAIGHLRGLWQIAFELHDDLVGLDWRWQSVDGAMTKAPLGGESTGKNPTDRGKSGTKRSLLTEAAGIPIGLAVVGANVHEKTRGLSPSFFRWEFNLDGVLWWTPTFGHAVVRLFSA